MPMYEYQCSNCEARIERLQKISDAPLVDCPECAQPKLKKLVSAAGFRLKGSGWYETDFKTPGKDKIRNVADRKADTGTASSDSAAKSCQSSKTAADKETTTC